MEASEANTVLTAEELTEAVRQIPELRKGLDETKEQVSGIVDVLTGTPMPVTGERQGGMVAEQREMRAFIYKVVFTILGSNAAAGVLIYLATRGKT